MLKPMVGDRAGTTNKADEEFAALMRRRRGEPPRPRVVPWRQLLDISIANVHEMITAPGTVLDDGKLERLDGIVEVVAQSGDLTTFEVRTKHNVKDAYEEVVSERQIRHVHHDNNADSAEWQLVRVASRKLAVPQVLVRFNAKRYARIVKELARMTVREALATWLLAFEDEENPILEQPMSREACEVGARTEWYVAKVTAPVAACINARSIEFVEVQDEDDRATLWLKKRADAWIDHAGKLATPWGIINVADEPATVRADSQLARELGELESGPPKRIAYDVWVQGLQMPSFDRELVQRILDAQTVLVEVPLVA